MSENEKKVSRRELLKQQVAGNPWFEGVGEGSFIIGIIMALATSSRVDAYQKGKATALEVGRVVGVETAVLGGFFSIIKPPVLKDSEVDRRSLLRKVKDGAVAGTVFSATINTSIVTTASIDKKL